MQTKHKLKLQHIWEQLPSIMANMKRENENFPFAVLLANFYDVSLDYLAGRTNLPKNPHGITIADDALLVLQKYTALTERNKGRLEQFLDTLSEQQAQQKETRSSV